MGNRITTQNIILVSLFVFTIILAALILRPLIPTMLTALIIGYIFYPAYKKIKDKIKNRTIASILVSIIIVLLITVPIYFIVNSVANEAYVLYTRTKQVIVTGQVGTGFCEDGDNFMCNTVIKINNMMEDTKIRYYLQQGLERIINSIVGWATSFALSIPIIILEGLIMLFILFYFFKDHKRVVEKLKLIIPLKSRYRKYILEQVENVTYAVVFGYIIIALIEGIIGAIGFRLFMPNSSYMLWGLMIAFLALIPFIGATLVWIPAIIIQIINKHYFLTVGLIVCMAMTSYMDTISRPKIIGKKANVHPVYVLLGVIGGLAFLGVPGIVIGPLTLVLLNTFLKIFTGK